MSSERIRLGVFHRNEKNPRYDVTRTLPSHSPAERVSLLNMELDKYAV